MVVVDVSIMHRQANVLNHLAKELLKRANQWSLTGQTTMPIDVAAAHAGFVLVAPFAMELALKALHAQQSNGLAHKTHDLVAILDSLPAGIEQLLENELTNERTKQFPEYADVGITARQVIGAWEDAFTEWRYLAEGPLPTVDHTREGPLLTDAILNMSQPNP